jgi:hypothetical protein
MTTSTTTHISTTTSEERVMTTRIEQSEVVHQAHELCNLPHLRDPKEVYRAAKAQEKDMYGDVKAQGKDGPPEMTAEQMANAVAVGVGRTEDFIKKNIAAVQREVKKIEGIIKSKEKAICVWTEEAAIREVESRVLLLNNTLLSFPPRVKAVAKATCNIEKRVTLVRVELVPRDKDAKFGAFEIATYDVPFNEVANNTAADVKELYERLTSLREVGVEWRKRIGDMAAVERKARAQVAEHQLSQTKEGKEILAKVEYGMLLDTIDLPPILALNKND